MEKPKAENVVDAPTSPEHAEKKERKKHEKHEKHDKHDKHQKNEKNEDKKVRHERPAEYERNADLITQDTVLQPLPKKNELLQRPNLKDYQQKEAKNREKISDLIKSKKQLFDQKFKPTKPFVKGEGGAFGDFQVQIQEFNQIKERFIEVKNQRNQKRQLLTKLIQQAKANNADIKKFRDSTKNSRQFIQQQIERLEHKLTTDQLSKDQEKNLNTQIMTLKRKVKECEPSGNYEVKIAKAQQRKQQLDVQIQRLKQQKQPLEKQAKELKQQMDAKNAAIEKLKGQIKTETNQKTQAKQRNDKQYEQWKLNKKKKIDDTNDKIKKIEQINKGIWQQYRVKNDAYWEQKHKVDFLQWKHRVKERKIRDKQRQQRKAVAIEKEKEREKQQQLKKYIKQIQLCTFLTNYLKELTKQNQQVKQQQKVQKPQDINKKLEQDKQWKKQKGLVILQSKKSKQEEEPVKKGKKNKKKNEKADQASTKKFQVPFNIQVLFDQIKVLPPDSLQEVQKKIAQLKEREALFERACSQQVNQADKLEIEKIKGNDKKEKANKSKQEKKQQDEFPTL